MLTLVAALVVWVARNSVILVRYGKGLEPHPCILLNLLLSMLAAVQGPIILMSRNRQAEKDRLNAEHDHEVKLNAEPAIMLLHQKMDLLREGHWGELLAIQRERLRSLGKLIRKNIVRD